MKMNGNTVFINGRFLSQPVTGVQRYAHELLSALDDLLISGRISNAQFTVLAPRNLRRSPPWKSIRIRQVGKRTGHIWEQVELPRFVRGHLLFTPSGGAPVLHSRNVITIHDAAIFSTPYAYSRGYRVYYRILQRLLSYSALHVITVSEFSKNELIRHLRLPPDRISVTLLSGQHILRETPDPGIFSRLSLPRTRYILTVSSRNPNKNIPALEAAFASLNLQDVKLLLAGGSNTSVFGKSETLGSSIQQLGTVSDAELRSLYEHATCFVFPSMYEGFGLPPLEAMTLGCPIAVSRAASLPEVFGDAARYFDPSSVTDIATCLSSLLLGNRPKRQKLIEKSNEYSWEACALQTWSILKQKLHTSE
jgi:glycosyltransferase involved in cell wall biosynthesis